MFNKVVFVSLACAVQLVSAQVPDKGTPTQQLNAACKANPTHEICVARQAKKDKATQKREERIMKQVQDVVGTNGTGITTH